jgi:hypothetical protein
MIWLYNVHSESYSYCIPIINIFSSRIRFVGTCIIPVIYLIYRTILTGVVLKEPRQPVVA